MTNDTLLLPGPSPVEGYEIHARFNGGTVSSDGGVLVLRQIERRLKCAEKLASCLHDGRDPSRTAHSHTSMIRERIFAIARGYEDCDDLDDLRHDPALKRLLEDIEAGRIDAVVVYKVDRLTCLPGDFAKIVEVFDRRCHVNQEKHRSDWKRPAMPAG